MAMRIISNSPNISASLDKERGVQVLVISASDRQKVFNYFNGLKGKPKATDGIEIIEVKLDEQNNRAINLTVKYGDPGKLTAFNKTQAQTAKMAKHIQYLC